MDKVEILRRAVTKAKKQGYFLSPDMDAMLFNVKDAVCHDDSILCKGYLMGGFCYYKIIYSIRFTEIFWGKDWQSHLQAMVILREPIEYLEQFVKE